MKLSCCLLLAVTCLSSGISNAHPAYDHPPLVTVTSIADWLRSPERPVQSVEALLERLPEAYRSYYVLQYASRSMHRASPEKPRMIIYGPDARLLAGISTDPDDPRRDVVELIEFDPATATFSAAEIDFAQPRPVVTRPAMCAGCHRADLRPNWAPYDGWPGTFGTVHDTLRARSDENHWYSGVQRAARTDGRLAALPRLAAEPSDADALWNRYTVTEGIGANAGLSVVLGFANRERMTRRMLDSVDHDRYRFAIAATLMNCPQSIEEFIPAGNHANHPKSYVDVLDDTRRRVTEERRERVALSAELLGESLGRVEDDVDRYGLREAEIQRTARLRYLLENRSAGAVDMESWSTTFALATYTFHDGMRGLEGLIGHYAPKAFPDHPDLVQAMSFDTVDLPITSFNGELHGPEADLFQMQTFQNVRATDELCNTLKSQGAR